MHLKHITTTAIVFALAIATASAAAAGNAPAATAILPNPDQQHVTEQPRPTPATPPATRTIQPNPDQQPAATSAPPRSTPAVIVRINAPNSGFDWGDAAIGAAAALGLSLMGLAAALAVSQRRRAPVEGFGKRDQQTSTSAKTTSRQPAVDQIATDAN